MEDLHAKLEKLLIEAEDCDLIAKLATDLNKRELFKRLAVDLRTMARDIRSVIAKAVPVPPSFSETIEKSKLPVWDTEHLRLAIAAAGVALWSWNVDTNRFTMDERAFELWGVPLSEYVTFDDLSAHIHPADRDRVRRRLPLRGPSSVLMKSTSAS